MNKAKRLRNEYQERENRNAELLKDLKEPDDLVNTGEKRTIRQGTDG